MPVAAIVRVALGFILQPTPPQLEASETPNPAAEHEQAVVADPGDEPDAASVDKTTTKETLESGTTVASPSDPGAATDSEAPLPETEAAHTSEAAGVDLPAVEVEPEERKAKITVGLQVFLRAQGRANPDFDSDTPGHRAQVQERLRLHARGSWGPLAGFVQVQEARTFTFERSQAGQAGTIGFHQGFAEVSGERSSRKLEGFVRAGRQEIAWGRQRLVGPLLWAPGARAFNAVRALGRIERWTLDGFASYRTTSGTVSTPIDPTMPDAGDTTVDVSSGGFFGATRLEFAAHDAISVELMGLVDRVDAHPTELGDERIIGDFGGRVWGKPARGISYDVEAHVQGGERGGLDHRAWAWAAAADWHADKTSALWPGVGLGYAMGSGQRCTGSPGTACAPSSSKDFFNFYPTNHIHYGIADLMSWSNMRDLEVRGVLAHRSLLDFRAAYHWLQLHEPAGQWTGASGGLVASGWDRNNDVRDLGHELDAVLSVRPLKPLTVSAGYAVFVPSSAARRLMAPDPQHFFYLWLVADF